MCNYVPGSSVSYGGLECRVGVFLGVQRGRYSAPPQYQKLLHVKIQWILHVPQVSRGVCFIVRRIINKILLEEKINS